MAKTKKVTSKPDEFDIFLQKVGARMRQLRTEKGYTNYEHFAYDHNIGRAQYGKYEKGRDDLRLSSLHKVILSYGLTFKEFFDGDF